MLNQSISLSFFFVPEIPQSICLQCEHRGHYFNIFHTSLLSTNTATVRNHTKRGKRTGLRRQVREAFRIFFSEVTRKAFVVVTLHLPDRSSVEVASSSVTISVISVVKAPGTARPTPPEVRSRTLTVRYLEARGPVFDPQAYRGGQWLDRFFFHTDQWNDNTHCLLEDHVDYMNSRLGRI